MKHGKLYKEASTKVDRMKRYGLEEAVILLKECKYTKFDESVEVAINLGVDPRHADQMIRGSVVLPRGTGKKVKIAVFAEGEDAEAAKAAGADVVGSDDLVEKIKEGWLDFDVAISHPSLMGKVGKLGRTLGPRGLMPNPKSGTVAPDVARAVKEARAGKIEYRVDKAGIIHTMVGKVSFETDALVENCTVLIDVLEKARPVSVKGVYFKSMALSSTMGPGIKIDLSNIIKK
ncbi:50S ribosomal protein L1 [bacterium]|nr:50S ribosomal protein L1 [bacterium]